MFEVLRSRPVDEVIGGVYYAIRLIRHRNEVRTLETGLRIEGLKSEPSEREQDIALEALHEIERIENRSIQELDESTAEDYIAQLANIVRIRARSELGCDEERGRSLLARFEPLIAIPAGGTLKHESR
jgi:hypothetical protein